MPVIVWASRCVPRVVRCSVLFLSSLLIPAASRNLKNHAHRSPPHVPAAMSSVLPRGASIGLAKGSGCQPATPVRRAVACGAATTLGAAHSPAMKLDAAYLRPSAQPMATVPVQPAQPLRFPALLSAVGRTPEQVVAEVQAQLQHFPQALVQGVQPEMYASMRKALSGVQYQARARVAVVKPKPEAGAGAVPLPAKQRRLPGMVCVVSAGPADQAAADAVKLMAEHLGCFVTAKGGLSTGDLPALLEQLPALQAADVVIAVAGADSGLPGVVAGMVDAPVVALPTAAGDAGGLGGLGSLVSAVASAAAGVSVVGIDQAGAAASTAARILRTAAARVEKLTAAAAAAASAVPAGAAASAGLAANNVVPHSALDGCLTLTPAVPVAAAAPAH